MIGAGRRPEFELVLFQPETPSDREIRSLPLTEQFQARFQTRAVIFRDMARARLAAPAPALALRAPGVMPAQQMPSPLRVVAVAPVGTPSKDLLRVSFNDGVSIVEMTPPPRTPVAASTSSSAPGAGASSAGTGLSVVETIQRIAAAQEAQNQGSAPALDQGAASSGSQPAPQVQADQQEPMDFSPSDKSAAAGDGGAGRQPKPSAP